WPTQRQQTSLNPMADSRLRAMLLSLTAESLPHLRFAPYLVPMYLTNQGLRHAVPLCYFRLLHSSFEIANLFCARHIQYMPRRSVPRSILPILYMRTPSQIPERVIVLNSINVQRLTSWRARAHKRLQNNSVDVHSLR